MNNYTALEKMPCSPALGSDTAGKTLLCGLTRDKLTGRFEQLGIKPFRAKQLWNWLYHHGRDDWDSMHTIARHDREILSHHFSLTRPTITQDHTSSDDTRKWLLRYADGNEAETVFIPEKSRGTLCVSSQVGCTLACTFCHTGTQRLVRNLSTADIVSQYLVANDGLSDWPIPTQGRRITNIVFMGMGEPLYNYDHVKDAVTILTDPNGIQLSRRKVTISTSGVVPEMIKMTDEIGCNLALSLHAVRDDLRDEIVPINRKYKLKDVLEACRYYASKHSSQHILIEYVMLKGVNDSDADAHALIELLKDIPSKVNLIPFNPWPGAPYECSSNNRIHAFGRILMAAGLPSPIRTTRGDDILAACGQLKSQSELKKGQRVRLK